MSNRERAIPIFLLMFLLMSGCMLRTGSLPIETQNPQSLSVKLKVGETTRDDVQKEFGNPTEYSTSSTGEQTWIYAFVGHDWFWNSPIRKYKTLEITFDNNGKVSEYNLTTNY